VIGLITGIVDAISTNFVIIDTGSIGYKVLVSNSILSRIKKGDKLKVYIYSHVREDAFDLFGFDSLEDLALFEQFLTVPGIGPKTAIGIFGAATTSQIRNAVFNADISFFSQVPRLGKKNAQKIILELKSKLGDIDEVIDFSEHNDEREMSVALKDFGFKPVEIAEVLKKIRGQGSSIEEKMKLALKQLGK